MAMIQSEKAKSISLKENLSNSMKDFWVNIHPVISVYYIQLYVQAYNIHSIIVVYNLRLIRTPMSKSCR